MNAFYRLAGGFVINCCYAPQANLRGVKVTGLAETKSRKMTFFGNRKNILDEKILSMSATCWSTQPA